MFYICTSANPDSSVSRAVPALATKERKGSQVLQAHLVQQALQGLQLSLQSAKIAPVSQDPKDQLKHQVSSASKDHQELMESQSVDYNET